MSKTRFLLVPFTFLIIIGLLIAGGWATHRIGWAEGYRMGQLAAGGQQVAGVPYAPFGLSYLALFLTVGFIGLLILMMVGKLFRLLTWKAHAGPWMMAGHPWRMAGGPGRGKHGASRWHWRHGPMHHSCWGWEEPSEEEVKPDGLDTDTGEARAEE